MKAMNRQRLTVSMLTSYLKMLIESDTELQNLTVTGEVSNYKYHSSGHIYFTLKDKDAKIKCVMFRSYASFLKFIPSDGMKIVVSGNISIYERDGQYQLYCHRMEPDGIGNMYMAFEQLKEKLENEGLFNPDRKRPIPILPRKIGVATSPTGAVIRDIINVATNRFFNIDILLYPVKVQGDGAAESITKAIKYFNSRDDIDVIIVGRGGGSIEELWAFNEEAVARAIYGSKIPIISAVGHETDFTIADFVADVRASTPSHAAEIAVPKFQDLKYKIESLKSDIESSIEKLVVGYKYSVQEYRRIIQASSPLNRVKSDMQYLDNLEIKINHMIESRMAEYRSRMAVLVNKLDNLNPAKMISRGYAYVEKEGIAVRSIKEISYDDFLQLYMRDGKVNCKVINILED